MGLYRTYIDKSTTIVSNSSVNTARNEIAQLYYGNGYSRHLFYVDFSNLKKYYTDKTIIPENDVQHVLKFTNTSSFDIQKYLNVENNKEFGDKNRSVSFELELHEIPEYWDSGTGYGYSPAVIPTNGNEFISEPANWLKRTTLSDWTVDGAIPTGSTPIATQYFELGSEDIEMDITDFVNNHITGNTVYYGFCIKYPKEYEDISILTPNYTGFLTKHTGTFFKPFIETRYNDTIKDDRYKFYINKPNKLYLYSNVNGNLTNLDNIPSVSVNGTNYDVKQRTKGVYEINLQLTGLTTNMIYNDVWSDVNIDGISKNKTMKFTVLPDDDYYDIGGEVNKRISYDISITGVNNNEFVTKNEIRKVIVDVQNPFIYNQKKPLDSIQYRIFIKQGPHDINIVNWQNVNRASNLNYFLLNTEWMIPQKYYIDILIKENDQSRIYNQVLTFQIKTVDNYLEA